MTSEQRIQAESLLQRAKDAQTEYWAILGAFEELTCLEIDSTHDLQDWTLDSLMLSANVDDTDEDEDEQEIPACTACGCTNGTCNHAA